MPLNSSFRTTSSSLEFPSQKNPLSGCMTTRENSEVTQLLHVYVHIQIWLPFGFPSTLILPPQKINPFTGKISQWSWGALQVPKEAFQCEVGLHQRVPGHLKRAGASVYTSVLPFSVILGVTFPSWWTGCLNPTMSQVCKCTDSSSYEATPAQPIHSRLAIPAPNTPFLFLHPLQPSRIWEEKCSI